MKSGLYILLFLFLSCFSALGQSKDKRLIQFSGIVIATDSALPVAFASVTIKGSNKGTVTDFWGFFSLPVEKRDTVEFSAIGYKKMRLLIPDSVKRNQYYSVIELKSDTIVLNTVVIRPWPPIEQFKNIFLAKKVPDDMMERAKKNLDQAKMKASFDKMPMDGSMNFRNTMQQQADRMYYWGQYTPNRLLDPIAWSKFIKAWQNGELKIKKDEY